MLAARQVRDSWPNAGGLDPGGSEVTRRRSTPTQGPPAPRQSVSRAGPLHPARHRVATTFTLRGHVSGLFPGASTQLVIVVRNRSRRSLRVRSVTMRVRDAKPGWSAKNLRASAFRGRLWFGHVASAASP